MKTKDISISALCLALLVLCAKITIPFGFIPITLQTLAVFLCGLLLERKQILLCFSAYLLAGLCGLPVFANGGGPAYLLQPSFGFLLSFPLAALWISTLRSQFQDSLAKMMLISLSALILIYSIGAIYMFFIFHQVLLLDKGFIEVLQLGVLPFILNDAASALLACLVAQRLQHSISHIIKHA